jgi:hypothetical protein
MAYEYKFQGKTVRLEADPSVVAVRFKDPSTKSINAARGAARMAYQFASDADRWSPSDGLLRAGD